MNMEECEICPRKCRVNRKEKNGYCMCGPDPVVRKTMLHMWEEPPVSGKNGSGAVFFAGCNLRCVYCQNKKISHSSDGTVMTPDSLADLFISLQEKGAHNINLVTPTHFADGIIRALDLAKGRLNIPVIYNTGGYESFETLKELSGYIDVYLTDFKYFDSDLSAKYSGAPDYFEAAIRALPEMYRQVGEYTEDEKKIIKKGVILRHLVLPGCRRDSVLALEAVKEAVPVRDIRLSLMSQFIPDFVPAEFKELKRRVTSFEYGYVLEKAIEMGYRGFFQRKESASAEYVPDF